MLLFQNKVKRHIMLLKIMISIKQNKEKKEEKKENNHSGIKKLNGKRKYI